MIHLENGHHITIFDCTLREAGYQTGWFFDKEFCRDLLLFDQSRSVDYLEVGFFHSPDHDPDKGIFRYCSEKQNEIKDIFNVIKTLTKISAMRDIQRPLWPLVPREAGVVDAIRILTRSNETDFDILKKQVEEIRSFGYEIFINFTSAGTNSMARNADFAKFAADMGIPTIYFADTESIMSETYVVNTIEICHKNGVKVGMHFHDKNGTGEKLMKVAIANGTDGLDFTLMGLGGKWRDGNLTIETYLHKFGFDGGYELTHLKNELISNLVKYSSHSVAG